MLNQFIQLNRIIVVAILVIQGQAAIAQQCKDGSCCLKSTSHDCKLLAPIPRRTPTLTFPRPTQTQDPTRKNLTDRTTPASIKSPPFGYRSLSKPVAPVWQTDITKAAAIARESGRPMVIRITAKWCGYCRKMKADTFSNAGIQRDLVQGFVTVEIDADKNKELVKRLGVQSLPTTFVLTPDMQIAERMEGYRSADQLQTKLNQFLPRAELHRDITIALR